MSIGAVGPEAESRLVNSGAMHYAPELGMDQPLTVKARSAELNIESQLACGRSGYGPGGDAP